VPIDEQKAVGRKRNEFKGNDFNGCEFFDVGFRSGIDLEAQRLPTGPGYLYLRHAKEAVLATHAAVEDWPDPTKRSEALGLLRFLDWTLAGGQTQLLLDRNAYSDVPRDVLMSVFETLAAADRS
jgi:hypothetical protein